MGLFVLFIIWLNLAEIDNYAIPETKASKPI